MAVSCVFLVLRTVARYVKTKKVPYEAEDIASTCLNMYSQPAASNISLMGIGFADRKLT